MRKTVLATAIMLIVILMVPMKQGVIVRAGSFSLVVSIRIESPQNQEYKTSSVNVSVVVETFGVYNELQQEDIIYFLDGKPCAPLSLSLQQNGAVDFHNVETGTLNNLTDGYHNLKIRVLGFYDTASTIFLVNATGYHSPQLFSPLNTTYSKNNVPLTYACEENRYSVYYKLDNSNYTTITNNNTLSDLSMGQHTINIKGGCG